MHELIDQVSADWDCLCSSKVVIPHLSHLLVDGNDFRNLANNSEPKVSKMVTQTVIDFIHRVSNFGGSNFACNTQTTTTTTTTSTTTTSTTSSSSTTSTTSTTNTSSQQTNTSNESKNSSLGGVAVFGWVCHYFMLFAQNRMV